MSGWKEIKLSEIIKIDKFVAEFEVWELEKIPYGKFKVKIFESADGKYTGRTNLMVIDEKGSFCPGVGYGKTEEQALSDTIKYFYSLIDEVDNLSEDSFQYVDAMDF